MPCPPCLENTEYLAAPDCYHEKRRPKVLDKYAKLKHWDHSEFFNPILLKIRRMFGISGVSISLISGTKAKVKYETRLGFRETPREILIDSHCILSEDGLVFLDTAIDWRTKRNPLVTGPPYIRFYSGARLVDASGVVIGALSMFDSYPKMSVSERHIRKLQVVAKEVMEILTTPYDVIASRYATSNTIDEDIRVLSANLLRARSGGKGMAIIEKDGSRYFETLCVFMKAQSSNAISAGTLSENERKSVLAKISDLTTLKSAAKAICESIAIAHKVDFVCILRVRMADLYVMPKEFLPSDTKQIDIETFKHANKLTKCRKSQIGEYFQTRMVGFCGSEPQNVDFDNILLKKAFLHEIGIQYTNLHNNLKHTKGVLMNIHKSGPKLVPRSKKAKDSNNVRVYMIYGGYILGVVNQSSRKSEFTLSEMSRMFDQVSFFRKLYLV